MVRDSSEALGKIVALVFESNDVLQKQNAALQTMLLKRGLTKQGIRREMREYLKDRKMREDATQLLTRVAQECLKIVEEADLSKALAKLPTPKRVH